MNKFQKNKKERLTKKNNYPIVRSPLHNLSACWWLDSSTFWGQNCFRNWDKKKTKVFTFFNATIQNSRKKKKQLSHIRKKIKLQRLTGKIPKKMSFCVSEHSHENETLLCDVVNLEVILNPSIHPRLFSVSKRFWKKMFSNSQGRRREYCS